MEIRANIFIDSDLLTFDTKISYSFPHQFIPQIGSFVKLPESVLEKIVEEVPFHTIDMMWKMKVEMIEYDYEKPNINLILSII
jgi:hypothetical protein